MRGVIHLRAPLPLLMAVETYAEKAGIDYPDAVRKLLDIGLKTAAAEG